MSANQSQYMLVRSYKQLLRVYQVIKDFIAENGHSPTTKELVPLTGIKSTESVNRVLEKLEQIGWITRLPYKSRTITITCPAHQDTQPESVRLYILEQGDRLAHLLDKREESQTVS